MKPLKDLRIASDRVYYEYWMLHHLAEILDRELAAENENQSDVSPNSTGIVQTASVPDKNRIVTNNARVEAFGIHTRALQDFFYGLENFERQDRKPRRDDVFAEHFFDETEHWRDIRLQLPDDFGAIRTRINKEILHITFKGARVKPESKIWLFEKIKKAIENAYTTFKDHALKERLGKRWDWQ